ncbi:deoxyribodipyrimidine photo-lyase [Candidatus Saccharibacteria bacterium]|nr:deoxyribodipyrimidine photo-lyase [Candidatus Saccharibacteria bacterium]
MQRARIMALNSKQSEKGCVLYLMSRDQRVADNHALLAAQADANERREPLIVAFNLYPQLGVRAREQYEFMLKGLREVETKLNKLSIPMVMSTGDAAVEVPKLCKKLQAAALYCDFSPLRGPRKMQKTLAAKLDLPIYVVDTHNIVPVWVLSDKQEFAAHTIRRKVHTHLEQWLVEPEQPTKHQYPVSLDPIDWQAAGKILDVLPTNGIKPRVKPGEKAGKAQLRHFVRATLPRYAAERNDPNAHAQTGLSPYLHFGHLSSLRVALEVLNEMREPPLLFQKAKLVEVGKNPTIEDNCNALLEELIVRKELSDNYCFYTPHYDSLEGAWPWAKQTLAEHADDPREFLYTRNELEACETHDDVWNAAQRQMMDSGIMHGYMRMYWAKKS